MTTDADLFAQILPRDDHRVFTLGEAQALFPLVNRLTREAYDSLEPVRHRLEVTLPGDPALREAEAEYERIVRRWVGKMDRLGLAVRGLWLVDFDTGDGYLCWRFPELRIAHYHGYQEGFDNRRPLNDVVEELDPDWARA